MSSCFRIIHILPFFPAGAGYDSTIPDAPNAESHQLTKTLAENVGKLVDQYLDAMEKVGCVNFSSIFVYILAWKSFNALVVERWKKCIVNQFLPL